MSRGISYSVDEKIFENFPGYVRGVVVASGVTNVESPATLVALLRDAEDALRSQVSVERLAEHPRIASWREAFRSFGARPSDYRSSIEAMARRVLRGHELPSINALVDIGNIVSLRHMMPVGGHDFGVMRADVALRFAAGTEEFFAIGSDEAERPEPGEVVFAEGDTVLTRRWVWRQGVHTAATLDTTHVEINVDGMPPVSADDVKRACGEVAELVKRFCGGETRIEMLSEDNPVIRLGL
ncbi:MAG: hypothetical protein IIC83_07885 [Chloroflexi bacterium]|nr:hypothetical protein [Chloroflexota bacterium]